MRLGIVVVLAALVGGLVIGGLWLMGARNTLVDREEQVRSAWSQVQNVYQRRMDLVPNLVETVKGAAAFEKDTFTDVAEARARAGQIQVSGDILDDPAKFQQFAEAQRALGSGLSRLLATAEAYPQLRASENFRDLQAQLEGTENRIAVERKRFNDAVQEYNRGVRRFPTSVAAGMFGFDAKPYFEADAGASEAPKVKF